MKKIFLISITILLTSFKEYQADSGLTFDYEIKYEMDNQEFSVFVSKSNSKDFLMSMTSDYFKRNNSNLFSFLQDTRLFKLRISDSNEIDWSGSEYEGNPSNQQFNELVETNETKIINNLKCNRYLGKAVNGKSKSVEVYISKNNKINNVLFLFSLRTKMNPSVKGLVMEMNSIDNETNKTKSGLTLTEIKQIKKTIKFDDENLTKLIKKQEYHKKHENDETVTAEIEVKHSSPKWDSQTLERQLSTGHLELNQIEEFPFDKIYEINKDMDSLTINDSPELRSLPESVKDFKSLSEVSIYGTRLTEFPMGFCYTNSLTTFVYGGNLTTTIPKEIGNLKNLKNLTLYSLPLKEIPKEIGNLENLQLLFIHDTKGDNIKGGPFRTGGMHYIPKEIGNLKSLEHLELENNNLMEVPKEIGSLNKLTDLGLRDNNLKSLPKEIYNLQNLKTLDLSNNPLESISEEISKLKKLELLNLRNTNLKSLPKGIYSLQNLEILDLSNISLESIPEDIVNLKKLKKLDLSENKIPGKKILELMHKMPNTDITF